MTIMVIDGQGGKMGKGLVEMLKKSCPEERDPSNRDEQHRYGGDVKGGGRCRCDGRKPGGRHKPHGGHHRGPDGDRYRGLPDGGDHPEDGRCDRPEPGKKGSDPGKPLPAFCCGLQGRFDGRICKARGGGSAEDPARGAVNKR